jgi:HK97 family phage prohead protease/HK97 family phage major capsid protein
MGKPNFDFSGYATKNGLKCADGRTIIKDAFKHQNGQTVPLVWQHLHNEPANILGHAILENREDGVYCRATFNDTEAGKNAKQLVEHGDISALSIHANQLKQKGADVLHGMIREVSLVLAGANPGALIDNLSFAHGDGSYVDDESEAIIYTGLEFTHADDSKPDGKTMGDVFETLNEEQKNVVYAMLAKAIEDSDEKDDVPAEPVKHSATDTEKTVADVFNTLNEEQKNVVYAMLAHAIENTDDEDDLDHANEEGDSNMKKNVFDATANEDRSKNTLTHDQMSTIVADAKRCGSMKESFIQHATEYGFDPISILFPDAVATNSNGPELLKRDDTWVGVVMNEATHTPFARIKTTVANITADDARAKGYVTGTLKKDEIIPLLKRVTTPTTIYKKQKLDRDDMVDITDFDVVVWLKNEMRGMLNEELARVILIGDGRTASDEDKVNELNIRPIATDDINMYIHRETVAIDMDIDDVIDQFIRARKNYKGSGSPTLYTSTDLLTDMLLVKDTLGRRLYANVAELASVLRVSKIVEVEPMNTATRKVSDTQTNKILGIVVNMKDYTIGADKGGQVAMFDDFDIDYNQYKYLIETRVSGALTKPKSAIVVERAGAVG